MDERSAICKQKAVALTRRLGVFSRLANESCPAAIGFWGAADYDAIYNLRSIPTGCTSRNLLVLKVGNG